MKSELLTNLVDYLITWLCYGDETLASRVAYTADEKELEHYDVLIVPNGELGLRIVAPDMKNVVVEQPAKHKAIIRTDIVYNAFFFTSRAEELFNTERDEHGRFTANFSLLGYNNRLQIPMLDEHARLLLKLLNAPLPTPGFNHIYLTHDIDTISQYRHLRGALGGFLKGQGRKVLDAWKDIRLDPLYTFPWLIKQDKLVTSGAAGSLTSVIYFVKMTEGEGYDYPQYNLHGRDFTRLLNRLLDSGAKLGIHSSYYGKLKNIDYSVPDIRTTCHRSHYLRGSIRFFKALVEGGITDDFTMGFADQAGFRLQTTRAVRWINPLTYKLTTLTLHPLTIMDCSLSNANYMNLGEDEAYFVCERLIEKVRLHHGDLCLLWHNSILTPDTYHKSLYTKLLQLIQ